MDNELRKLRLSRNIPAAVIVECIRRFHPKFDKTMLSRCERSDVYGEHISREVMDALYREFAPELVPSVKWRRQGRHRHTKVIFCRLPDSDHAELLERIAAAGYKTIQDWMTDMVRKYISK